MFENFKTDIIYYNTQTDFELEFNLCGCCRMRLLNDKCSDKKSLLLSLARAVSRSNVIIITAPLFSEDNITKTIASAIGSTTQTIDNAEHNINSTGEIQIIKDALPLVTKDGTYGGCLIQSGPQTLILLTDNKPVRKTVMQSLIHPYIKEIFVCNLQKNEENTADTELEPVVEEMEFSLKPLDETQEETEPQEDSKDEILIEQDKADDSETPEYEDTDESIIIDSDEEDTPIFTDNLEDLFTEISPADNTNLADDEFYYENGYYTEQVEEKTSAFNVWFLIISLILLITIAVLCFCIFYVPTKAGVEPAAYLQEIFATIFA